MINIYDFGKIFRFYYLKVNITIFIHIECTKNMVTKFFCISRWKKHFIHVNEFSWSQTTIGTVLLHEIYRCEFTLDKSFCIREQITTYLKSFVPFFYSGFIIPSVSFQKLHILFCQAIFTT